MPSYAYVLIIHTETILKSNVPQGLGAALTMAWLLC